MMYKLGCILGVLVVAILIAMAGYSSQSKKTQDDILNRRVATDEMKNVSAKDALAHVLDKAEVPGGIVVVRACDDAAGFTRTLGDTTLRAALDGIVAANLQYKWKIRDGVVNLDLPNNDLPLLNVRVAKLEVTRAKTLDEALNKLLALPEVQEVSSSSVGSRMIQGGLYSFDSSGDMSQGGEQFSVTCTDVTVREALNAIVRAYGRATWVYTQTDCNGRRLFYISFQS
ncbi:MAG: hypothetical protein MSG64_15985 [Pyrinomonadaceae bacterium MAG19_C2-C3]|nr:hypothetical protein [Pyrinomonadaceae bacterium MAG19_C2-C3]